MNDLYKKIDENIDKNVEFIVTTIVDSSDSTPRKSGARMIVYLDGSIAGTVGGGILELTVISDAIKIFSGGENVLKNYNIGADHAERTDDMNLPAVCGGRVTVYFEVFKRKDSVFIFGGGHVGQKLALLLNVLEFPYYIVDNRNEYSSRDLFPGAREVFNIPYSEIDTLPIDERSYCVVMTHGHLHDAECVEKLLGTPAKYIGMIGSLNKVKTNIGILAGKGVNIDERLYAPIGLSITGNAPAQLAVSVISEILAVQAGKSEVSFMRDRFIRKYMDDDQINEILRKGGLIK